MGKKKPVKPETEFHFDYDNIVEGSENSTELLDKDGEELFCDNQFCENPAIVTVKVSESDFADSTRNYCRACYEAYMTGLQHRRFEVEAILAKRR